LWSSLAMHHVKQSDVNSAFNIHRQPDIILFLLSCERRLIASSCCPSVRPSAQNNSAPTGRIFNEFDIWVFFELSRKLKSL
jgi:hypothetical protein